MSTDSPDWVALTDVAPILLGKMVSAPGGGVSIDEFFNLPGVCTGVAVLLGDNVHPLTVTVIGLGTSYHYVDNLAVPAHADGPYLFPIQGNLENEVEVVVGDALGFPASATVAQVYALGASGYQVVQAPPHQPLQVDLGGRAVALTPTPLPVDPGGRVVTVSPNPLPVAQSSPPWSQVEPAPATILGNAVNAAPATIITIPAGRTWKGSMWISNDTAGTTAQIQTAGVGVIPAAGTALLVANNPGTAVDASNNSVDDVYVSAPAGNSVTLVSATFGAPVFNAGCNGKLL